MERSSVLYSLIFMMSLNCSGLILSAQGYEEFRNCIVITEQAHNRIVIANVESNKIIWEWNPSESNIDQGHISWFNNPSDAKVVYDGEYVIMSASGGACALIRIEDKKTMFYAYGGINPHSIEILPDGNIVCSSSTDNKLTVFKTDTLNFPDNLIQNTSFDWFSHNAVWDKKRNVLWTGNMNKIISWEYNFDCNNPELTPVDSIAFDDRAGHDLFPIPGEDALYFSAHEKLWIYDIQKNEITEIETEFKRIKSVSSESKGMVPIISVPKEQWWTDELIYLNGSSVFYSPGFKIYKARWIVHNDFSYPLDDKMDVCR